MRKQGERQGSLTILWLKEALARKKERRQIRPPRQNLLLHPPSEGQQSGYPADTTFVAILCNRKKSPNHSKQD